MTGAVQGRTWLGVAWVMGCLLVLDVVRAPAAYLGVVVASGLLLASLLPGVWSPRGRLDRRDLAVIGGLYLLVVGLFRLAFGVFTTANTLGLFLCFAAGLLIGVAGPVYYVVWVRRQPLASLGLRRDDWRLTALLALLFGATQFAITLWGYQLPTDAEDWVPLLVMALTVGVFESIFFRGFVQTRLQDGLGDVAGIAAAAGLYALYHVGYGLGVEDMLFLGALGVVYGVAFALVRNLLVIWPLLTPLGSFYANVAAGDIPLPWAAILGWVDVLALMTAILLLGFRHQRRLGRSAPGRAVDSVPGGPSTG